MNARSRDGLALARRLPRSTHVDAYTLRHRPRPPLAPGAPSGGFMTDRLSCKKGRRGGRGARSRLGSGRALARWRGTHGGGRRRCVLVAQSLPPPWLPRRLRPTVVRANLAHAAFRSARRLPRLTRANTYLLSDNTRNQASGLCSSCPRKSTDHCRATNRTQPTTGLETNATATTCVFLPLPPRFLRVPKCFELCPFSKQDILGAVPRYW